MLVIVRKQTFRVPGLVLALLLTFAHAAVAEPIDDYNTAIEFYKQQRWPQAEAELRKFLATNPNHERTPTARLFLGQALVHQRKFEPARDAFRIFADAHRDHPDYYLALYRIGECSYFLNDLTQARVELDRFISAYPQHELAEWALQYLGETQLRLSDPRAAMVTLQLQLNRFPEGRLAADARYLQARAQLAIGDRAAALTMFQTLAADEKSSRAAESLLESAMLLYDDRKFTEALTAFDALRMRFPESPYLPLADLNGGYAAYHLGNYAGAEERFEHAAAVPKQASEARFWKGMSQKARQDFAAAAETLKPLAENTEDAALAARARFHWADSLLRQKKYAEAKTEFLAVADQPSAETLAPDALHLATEAALLAGQLDEAGRLDDRFRQAYPQHGLLLLQRLLKGRIALARGDAAHDAKDAAAERSNYEAAATEFAAVMQESQIPRTSRLARLMRARVSDRMQQNEQTIETLTPLIEELTKQPEAEFAEAFVLQSRALLRLNRTAEAATAAQAFLERFPDRPQTAEVLATLATAQARSQDPDQVATALDQLWKREDGRDLARRTTYQLADAAYKAKDWRRAADYFRRLVDGGAGDLERSALSGLGYSLYEGGKPDEAAVAFASLVEKSAEDRLLQSDAYRMQALSLEKAGKTDEAETAYAAALKEFAFPADAANLTEKDRDVAWNAHLIAADLARLRRALMKEDTVDAAYQAAVEQLRLQPAPRQAGLDRLLSDWALFHYQKKEYDRADELFQQLIELRPDSDLADNARLHLAESDFFAGRLDEAREAFRKLEADPKSDDFVRHRAMVLLLDVAAEKQDWAEIQRLAPTLLSRFPTSDQAAYARYRLGEAEVQAGEFAKAAATLAPLHDSTTEAVREAEWFPSVRLLLARARLETKDYAGVEAIVERFRKEAPQSPYLHQADELLGRRYKNEARWDEARTAFQRAIDSESGRRTETAANAQLMIAETYLLQEKHEDALTAYYKVYANYKFPDVQAPALFQAARCDEVLGRWDGAVKSYELLIKEFPDSPYATQAAPLLEAARKKLPAAAAPAAK